MYGSGILRFFYLVGCANSLFFSVLVFSKKEKTIADKVLGYWLLALSVQLFLPFLYLANIKLFIHIIGFETVLAVIHPILLYNYTRALTQTQLTSRSVIRSLWPMLISTVSMLKYIFMAPDEKTAKQGKIFACICFHSICYYDSYFYLLSPAEFLDPEAP